MESFLRPSFSYDKLPSVPIRLSVQKLDGSSFDVRIKSSATVGDLKVAIEEAFDHVPKKGPAKISWSHVWGHFCLSFKGQKLVADTDCIGSYGVVDGDQIRFIRHVSGNAVLAKGYSKKILEQQKPSELLLGLKINGEEDDDEEEQIRKIQEMEYSWDDDVEEGSLESYGEKDLESYEGQSEPRLPPGISRLRLWGNRCCTSLGLREFFGFSDGDKGYYQFLRDHRRRG